MVLKVAAGFFSSCFQIHKCIALSAYELDTSAANMTNSSKYLDKLLSQVVNCWEGFECCILSVNPVGLSVESLFNRSHSKQFASISSACVLGLRSFIRFALKQELHGSEVAMSYSYSPQFFLTET